VRERLLFVVDDAHHAARFTAVFVAGRATWAHAGELELRLAAGPLHVTARARHQQLRFACTVTRLAAGPSGGPWSAEVGFVPPSHRSAVGGSGDGFRVHVDGPPLLGIAPGQWLVLYDGDVCLGGAPISQTLHK
jgi:tRNA U34 2-thiouridine synthase MnmA/TrmU